MAFSKKETSPYEFIKGHIMPLISKSKDPTLIELKKFLLAFIDVCTALELGNEIRESKIIKDIIENAKDMIFDDLKSFNMKDFVDGLEDANTKEYGENLTVAFKYAMDELDTVIDYGLKYLDPTAVCENENLFVRKPTNAKNNFITYSDSLELLAKVDRRLAFSSYIGYFWQYLSNFISDIIKQNRKNSE